MAAQPYHSPTHAPVHRPSPASPSRAASAPFFPASPSSSRAATAAAIAAQLSPSKQQQQPLFQARPASHFDFRGAEQQRLANQHGSVAQRQQHQQQHLQNQLQRQEAAEAQQQMEDEEEENSEPEQEEDALSTELAPRSSGNGRPAHNSRTAASASSSAFQRAEALLNHSDDDDDDDDEGTDEGVIHSAALHDEQPFAIEDGQMTEDYLEADEGQSDHAAAAAADGSRGSTKPSSSAVSSRRSTARTAASSTSVATGPQARSRMDRGAMRTWVQTHTTLKQRGELMEREHTSWLASKRAWFTPGSDEIAALDSLEREGHASSQALSRERAHMLSEIRRIHTLTRRFATYVAHPAASDEYISTLRSSMEQIEDALSKFKEHRGEQWASLEMEVKDLEKECKAKEASYERWSEEDAAPAAATSAANAGGAGSTALKKPGPKSNALGSTADESNDRDAGVAAIRAEITAVEDEIARDGGATGGWDARDHAHFLKLHTQLAGTGAAGAGSTADTADADASAGLAPEIESQLCARIALEIPQQTASTALLHLEWHARYVSLLARKKSLIARWKTIKARTRKDASEVAEELAAKAEAEAEHARLEAAAQATERAAKAEQIAAWKADKARRDSARAAREKAEANLKERQARQKAEEERRRLRSVVEAAAEERAAEAMVAAIASAPSAREIAQAERAEREAARRLREKQEALLAEVAAKRAAKEREAHRAEQRRAQLAAASAPALSSQRDPSRLVRPTSAMVERARQRESEEAEIAEYQRTHGGKTPTTMLSRPVLGMKATAGWRQGL